MLSRTGSVLSAWLITVVRFHPLETFIQLGSQVDERHAVCFRPGAHHEIDTRQGAQQILPGHFPQSSLEAVSLHSRMLVFWYDEADSRMGEKGSSSPELEMLGPDALPFTYHSPQVGTLRQPVAAREPVTVRRRRTCPGAGR